MMGCLQVHHVYFSVFIILLATNPHVNGDVSTASTDLSNVFRLEQQIVDVLGELAAKTEAKLVVIRKYLKDYEQSVVEEKAANKEEIMEQLTGNPIQAYRLMKRLYFDWQTVEKEIKFDNWQDAVSKLELVRKNQSFPKEADFFGATSALVRLQDTYELNMTELVRGNVRGRKTHAQLTALDCLFMGKLAFNDGAYARAVEWFEESYVLAGSEKNETISQAHVAEILQYAIGMHDLNLKLAKEKTPMSISDSRSFKLPLKEKPAVAQRSEIIRSRDYSGDDTKFNALCRGEKLLSEESVAKLKCWHDSRRQPYFFLMPIKVEQNSIEPAIYTFHEMLSDVEIETIKELAAPQLKRAEVLRDKPGGGTVISNVRTSKSAWFADDVHPLMDRLTRRISLVTGLKANFSRDEAEMFQVAHYGIGGHYSPHHDYLFHKKTDKELENFSDWDREMGDRIATFMFYLNDVERGGSTVFPLAGVAVTPVKGGAAFWYNLKRNGQGDTSTLHGGCPVLLGHKWVVNKWIREKAQTFNRGCLLDPSE